MPKLHECLHIIVTAGWTANHNVGCCIRLACGSAAACQVAIMICASNGNEGGADMSCVFAVQCNSMPDAFVDTKVVQPGRQNMSYINEAEPLLCAPSTTPFMLADNVIVLS